MEQAGAASLERERDYYEELYSGFAQQHFAKPGVVAFREHLVRRILRVTGANRGSRVLSVGSGTGDTELLLAPRVGSITGIDISPRGVEHAVKAASAGGVKNAAFLLTDLDGAPFEPESFDVILAVFFLHHLPEMVQEALPRRLHELLKPGGVLYALDPSRYRLSGALGKLLFPSLMRKYQTPGEQPLQPSVTWRAFDRAGFAVRPSYYDFASTPLAGLLPSWRAGYVCARVVDDALVRLPGLKLLSSNFEVIARKP